MYDQNIFICFRTLVLKKQDLKYQRDFYGHLGCLPCLHVAFPNFKIIFLYVLRLTENVGEVRIFFLIFFNEAVYHPAYTTSGLPRF